MMWIKAHLMRTEQIGADELGNPIEQLVEITAVPARFAPLTDSLIALEGRQVSNKSRNLLLRTTAAVLADCEVIICLGQKYEVKQTTTAGRFMLANCEALKNEHD